MLELAIIDAVANPEALPAWASAISGVSSFTAFVLVVFWLNPRRDQRFSEDLRAEREVCERRNTVLLTKIEENHAELIEKIDDNTRDAIERINGKRP